MKKLFIISILAIGCMNNLYAGSCGIRQLDTSISGNARGFKGIASNAYVSKYGLINVGDWASEFNYGVVYGTSSCNSSQGTANTIGTPDLSSSGTQCWCKINGFTESGNSYSSGPQCTVSPESSWVYNRNWGSECIDFCSYQCAVDVIDVTAFRRAMFASTPEDPSVELNWFDNGTAMSGGPSSCTVGGTFVPPTPPARTGYVFAGWRVKIVPRGFTELEYIESSGTQYIDTGFSAPNGFKAKVGLYFTTISPFFIMGAHGDVDPWGRNYFRIQKSGNRLLFEVGAGDCWVSSYVVQPNTKYDIEFSAVKNNIFLNGDTLTHGWGDGDDTRSPYSIYLFAVHGYQGGEDNVSMSGQMYYAKIYDENNVMVRQFIPVKRNSDNVVGMWDTVTQTFFTNAGTGNFVAGPVVQ